MSEIKNCPQCREPRYGNGTGSHLGTGQTECNTDDVRKAMVETGQPHADLAADKGQTWTTAELHRDFEVIGFAAPFVVARRRSDGVKGSLEFTHSPRVYFGWTEDKP
jgi:hypothetical protein